MKNGASEQCSWHSETDTKANFGEGCGKEAASDFVIQPQGAGGADSWARWGKVWTLGRTRMVKMEEKEGRRFEERWSRMEGGGDAASTASLEFHLGGCSCHHLPAFLLQPITVESSVSLTHQRLCDQKCHSPKHLYPLLSIQIRPNWFLVQTIERRLNHKCSLCDFPKSLLSSRWLNAAEPLLDIQQMSSNIITRPFATNSTMASALTNAITMVAQSATIPFFYSY